MTARITITLPDALLAELDKLAEAEGLSRSGIVREASAHYVAGALDEVAAERRRRAVEHTLATLDELRRGPVLDDRPSLEILREIRGPLGADVPEREE